MLALSCFWLLLGLLRGGTGRVEVFAYMLYTHPQVRDILAERAQDWNAWISRQVERVNTPPASPHLNEQ
jgi:hypothetical protein